MISRRFLHLLLTGLLLLPHPVAPATITVDGSTGDVADDGVCTLVEAIDNANDDAQTHADCAAGSGADDVVLTVDVTLTDPVVGIAGNGTGTPPISTPITIEGNDHTVARDTADPDLFRIFGVQPSGSLTLNDTTVSGGLISHPDAPSEGGGILNQGTLVLNGSTVSGNEVRGVPGSEYSYAMSAYGGGIRNLGDATITNSTISGNIASSVNPAYPDQGIYTVGGGITNGDFFAGGDPTLAITSSTISNNRVDAHLQTFVSGYGAGLYVAAGTVTMTNSTISGNMTYGNAYDVSIIGGGVAVADATAMLFNTTLSGNSLQAVGGTFEQALGEAVGYLGAGPVIMLYGSAIGNHTYGNSCEVLAGTDGGGNLADDATCDTIPATLTGLDATLADNGGGTETHALLDESSAIDAAGACGLSEDQRGVTRPAGLCDTGSYEVAPCGAPDGREEILNGETVTDERTVVTCEEITVVETQVLGAPAHLILRTAGMVVFENGVSVDSGGRLTVDIDGTIAMPDF